MKIRLIMGFLAALFSVTLFSIGAEAKAKTQNYSVSTNYNIKKKKTYVRHAKHRKHYVSKKRGKYYASKNRKHRAYASKHRKHRVYASKRRGASQATRNSVVAMIKRSAPRYGVPTWFALKIAKIESGYNPNVRGAAGEYGVYQLKCATARGIGFRGGCGALLNPSTNVQYGLKHLSMAVKLSRGNLRLAASKHNGGLGRKRLVRAYVRRVF
jgi:soluble lytic murein transglycosylase-like protein